MAPFYQKRRGKGFHRLITILPCLCCASAAPRMSDLDTGVRRQVLKSSTYSTATTHEQTSELGQLKIQ